MAGSKKHIGGGADKARRGRLNEKQEEQSRQERLQGPPRGEGPSAPVVRTPTRADIDEQERQRGRAESRTDVNAPDSASAIDEPPNVRRSETE